MLLSSNDIEALERRRRAALINSITGFKPANLVGTIDEEGHTNLSIMSSLVHIGSNPPLLALIFRPDNTERHTLDNIRHAGSYTINHVNGSIVDAAHQTAARYPREVSEFAATGLREDWQDGVAAPFVAEASVRMGMELREEIPIAINGTHMVIGEIVWLEAPDIAINDAGALDPALADSISISGLDSYYRSDLVQRMAYAKPDQAPQRLDS
ncbi:flavin reductase family protein [Congregibacter sp.]|uniref:flavin reductase family protein n=1 Tax=Congregibacter sp. TaxID=2744308 RepID=UPI00385BD023